MTLLDDADLIAAEYVLGSLEAGERAAVEERAAGDLAFAATIAVWERRLGPLNELIAPQKVPDGIWPKIAERLKDAPQEPRVRKQGFVELVAELSKSRGVDVAEKLMRDVKRWRLAAIAASLLAVLFAAWLGVSSFRTSDAAQLIGVRPATAAQDTSPTKTD